MLTTICCSPLSRLPYKPRCSLINRPKLGLSLNGSYSRIGFHSKFPTNKWRFLCFEHENFLSEIPGFESNEDKLSEDLVKPEYDLSKDLKKYWLSSLHEVIDAVFGVEPWTVPWTAKTTIQDMLLWIASFWFVRIMDRTILGLHSRV